MCLIGSIFHQDRNIQGISKAAIAPIEAGGDSIAMIGRCASLAPLLSQIVNYDQIE